MIALLSWLKDVDVKINLTKLEDNKENIEKILTSQDLFLVRNHIKRYNLMSGLTSKEIQMLSDKFSSFLSSFDTKTILNEFVYVRQKKLKCLICKKEFISPFEIMENLECKGEAYHPKTTLNNKNDKISCLHEGCSKKINKGDITCCHKPNSSGCIIGEGKHMIILID